jgi:hypothetical protein
MARKTTARHQCSEPEQIADGEAETHGAGQLFEVNTDGYFATSILMTLVKSPVFTATAIGAIPVESTVCVLCGPSNEC